MDYSKTTPYTRYSLNIEDARSDLKAHGVDFTLVDEIQGKLSDITSEYGDTPEVALACIAKGYNAKCMASQDSEFVYAGTKKENESFYLSAQAFQVIDALAKRHEDEIYEVISSLRLSHD
tara:strand:+ start:173 stop:532 length:360 start_codon:yes stop_codon:yes gene_type:complete